MKILNYLGQLRLYSLADLALLLVATRATTYQFWGAILLHIAFLAYLESKHAHTYREKIPTSISYILAIVGLFFFRKIEGLLYLLAGYFYTKKTKNLGWISPFFRGLQNIFIVGAITGYASSFPYIVGLIFFIRNFIGDMRDTEKDRMEGTKTIPVLLGIKKNIKHVHLFATITTSIIWGFLSPISITWLAAVIVIEIATYNLTPR